MRGQEPWEARSTIHKHDLLRLHDTNTNHEHAPLKPRSNDHDPRSHYKICTIDVHDRCWHSINIPSL